MKFSQKMQTFCEDLMTRHNFQPTLGAVLELSNSPYQPFLIQVPAKNQISVYHMASDGVFDPRITFFTGYVSWAPIAIQMAFFGGKTQTLALLNDECDEIARIDSKEQHSVASFANNWVTNLKDQGFDKAPKVEPMTRLLRPDGTVNNLQSTAPISLQSLQEMVDGYIEIVHLDGEHILVVNEECLFNGSTYNKAASIEMHKRQPAHYGVNRIHGNALFCHTSQVE